VLAPLDDPAPLHRRQLAALASGAGRELGWGLRTVSREVAAWQRHAAQIRAPDLRALALHSLADKRSLTEGAARFWEVPRRRDVRLIKALVAFQILANFLDTVSEQGHPACDVRSTTPSSIMLAFVDAVDVNQPTRDYYRDYPGWDDGGYLLALVQVCRSCCVGLPSYGLARTRLVQHARLAGVLDLHHDPDPIRRDRALRQFADTSFPRDGSVSWFEQAAAASSALPVIALLTLASEPHATERDLDAAVATYTNVGALSVVLDSFADQLDDATSGHLSFIGYYENPPAAVSRIRYLIERSLRDAADLPNGSRHVLLVSMMIAMFLSRDSVRSDALAADTSTLVAAGGTLTRCLAPVLRFWRISYRLKTG
jgi:tetraprenyl-beta-curcumene synthase